MNGRCKITSFDTLHFDYKELTVERSIFKSYWSRTGVIHVKIVSEVEKNHVSYVQIGLAIFLDSSLLYTI
jgi:hypothetical protein